MGTSEVLPSKGTDNKDNKVAAKEARVGHFYASYAVILFKGQHLIRLTDPYPHWAVMTKDLFERVFYTIFGGMSVTTLNDTYNMVRAMATPADHLADFIAMGDYVWDMRKCDFTQEIEPLDCVFYSPYTPSEQHAELSKEFVLQLADDRSPVADDIWQSLAPLITHKKPTGVIWYKGRGRNGKSGLLSGGDGVLARLFPTSLANVTLKQIEDERDAPALNGRLANIVDESSDGVIEDSRQYKAIGTHQDFPVHKFHSQEQIMISGNMHHIYSTNNMPVFSDKTDGARRRTLIIGFDRQFPLNENFYDNTFTEDFLSGFLHNLITYAKELKARNYVYEFSEVTKSLKSDYDKVVNTAETFAKWMVEEIGIQYFTNFTKLRISYEWWCDNNGYTALGKTHLRNAVMEQGFSRSSRRDVDGRTVQIFLHAKGTTDDAVEFMPGLYYSREAKGRIKEELKAEQEKLSEDW